MQAGTILQNRYKIVFVIGTGGFGTIYKAADLLLDCYVAVKEFSEVGNDSLLEAEILKEIRNVSYITRIRDYFEEKGKYYMVLTLIKGESLSEYSKKSGGILPAKEVLSLFQYLFDTLQQIHNLGIIHRDISPANLMLSEDSILYLIDFGSATAFEDKENLKNRQVFNHKGLEAPEHAQLEKCGPWTDIFSLCATMVYLLTGEGIATVSERGDYDHLPQLLTRTSLSGKQQNALLKGLSMDIKKRYQSVADLYEDLYGEEAYGKDVQEEWSVFYHAKTIKGTRPINQDNFMVDTECCYKGEDCEEQGILSCKADEFHMVAVCDGVGGSCYGELASKAAIQALIHFLEAYPKGEYVPDRLVEELLDQMNEKILQLGEKIGRTATTLAIFLWQGERYYAINIGDSPILCLRKNKLERLSTSHTRAALHIMLQKPVERSDWNTLEEYLGKHGVLGSQMAAFRYGRIQKGDVFLICSDGVTKKIEESRLKSYLGRKQEKSITSMFRILERQKQSDNCTAIVLKF